MSLLCGVDIVSIERIRRAVDRSGEDFLRRCWTEQELDYCSGRADRLAARWAAKEATMKMLACGLDQLDPRGIEVAREESGVPRLELGPAATEAARHRGVTSWSLSLSHEVGHAVAMVVAMTGGRPD